MPFPIHRLRGVTAIVVALSLTGPTAAGQAVRIGQEVLLGPLTASESLGVPATLSCSRPSKPIGYVRGLARISYTVRSNGRPDLATIRVDIAEGISPAGVSSIAARVLANCRVHGPGRPATVTQWLKFHSLDSTAPNGVLGWPPDSDSVPHHAVAASDPALDELPRLLQCQSAFGFETGQPFEAVITVTTSGRSPRGSVRVLDLEGPERDSKRLILGSCRWTPGRTQGREVSVRGKVRIGADSR